MTRYLRTLALFFLVCSAFAGGSVGYSEYRFENGHWTWVSILHLEGGVKTEAYILVDVDALTFTKINTEHAKDRRSVYFRGRTLKGADPATFRNLVRDFWCDDHAVYWGSAAVDGADPKTFERLNFGWAKDAHHYYSTRVAGLIVDCDYASLALCPKAELYARDKNRVYWCGLEIKGADVATFVADDGERAHDKFRHYQGSRPTSEWTTRMAMWNGASEVDMHTHR